jgi:hypothetical protein
MMVMLSAVVVGVALFAGVALANNTHTVGAWYHGLGDGKDNDYYVHPFNDQVNGVKRNSVVGLVHKIGNTHYVDHRKQVYSSHNHFNWETSYRECRYYSFHESNSNNFMNFHKHYHHNWCG